MRNSTPKRNEQYLQYIRQQRSATGNTDINIVAHHVRAGQNGGTGQKPSDYRCIPLGHIEHMTLHDMGEKSFYSMSQINHEDEIISNMLLYFASKIRDFEDKSLVITGLEDLLDQMYRS